MSILDEPHGQQKSHASIDNLPNTCHRAAQPQLKYLAPILDISLSLRNTGRNATTKAQQIKALPRPLAK